MSKADFSGVTEQRKAGQKRLRDAKALLGRPNSADWANKKGPHARGAMYLAGYAVECKIKAIAMEVHSCRTLAQLVTALGVDEQNVFDHWLEALLGHLPTLKARMQQDKGTWHAFAGRVNSWRVSWRYDPEDHLNGIAADFVDAIEKVYNWLESHRC